MLPGFPMPLIGGRAGPSLDLNDAAVFDGVDDFLSRSSDLAGNSNGREFTFSAWMYYESFQINSRALVNDNEFQMVGNGNSARVFARNSGNTTILNSGNVSLLTTGSWHHILVSLDLTSTARRHHFVDDSAVSPSWNTYTNQDMLRVSSGWAAGARSSSGGTFHDGRMCHVYLDYTYRDLTNVANRRLFNDGSGNPAANQAALNPIVYLPLTDSSNWGQNLGTGGDFSVNGGM